MPKRYATHITTPSGKRVYLSAKTAAELQQKVKEARVSLYLGFNLTDKTLFRDYAEMWFHSHKTPPKIRESSSQTLRCFFQKHILGFFGEMRLKEIKPTHVDLWLSNISALSRSTQAKCFQMLKAILAAAVEDGLILKTPVRSSMKISGGRTEPVEPLTREQSNDLLEAVRGTRAYGFCLLGLSTGMRRGELIGLMWSDIRWDEGDCGTIHVTHQKAFLATENDAPVTTDLKTPAARRVIPLTPALRSWLEQERARSGSLYVLSMEGGRSLTKGSFRALWQLVENRTETGATDLSKAVLPFRCHPHKLRHTYATRLFEQGMDIKQVQYLLGHEKPEMTMRIYVHYLNSVRALETAAEVRTALLHLSA